ncbi:MAG: ATP-binding protein [Solirubrobacteraceae bacterium]
MDEVLNPYAPGAGTQPPELAGRDREQESFGVLLKRLAVGRPEQNFALWGLRGVGKTVLLNRFAIEAEDTGWGSGYIELRGRGSLRPILAQVAMQAAHSLARREGIRERLGKALSVISSFSLTAMPTGVTFKLEVNPAPGRGDSGQLDVDLQDVLVELGETAREAGSGVVFFFDEMQFAENVDLQALLAAFHRIGQRQLPVALVCAGLPQLPSRLAAASSYAERLFQYVEIDRLTPEAARAALALPASRENVEYELPALDFILSRADRYPFFLQTYGRYAWLIAERSPITHRDAQAADTIAREQLDSGFHRARFNRATPAERRYLAAIAELGDDPQLTANVAAKLGANQRSTALVRQNLIDTKGLIYSPRRGYVDFTAPLFGDYIRRQHPLESLQ